VLGLGQRYEGHETKLRLYDEFLSSSKQSTSTSDGVRGEGGAQPQPTRGGGGGGRGDGGLAIGAHDVVMLVDAYDVLLSPSAAEVAVRFKSLFPDHPIVFAAERTLWPDAALEPAYPHPPTTTTTTTTTTMQRQDDGGGGKHALRFLNCGTVVGEAWALRFMLRTLRSGSNYGALTLCGPDDQRGFHRFFLENPELGTLDYRGALFQTLHFLTAPLFVEGSGQVLVLPDGDDDGGDGAAAEDDEWSRRRGDGGSGARPAAVSASQEAAWRQRPCAVHGNGGDGKPAFNRLVKGWIDALAAGNKQKEHRLGGPAVRVRVAPPPFSAGIALYMEGNLVGAEAAFREAAALGADKPHPEGSSSSSSSSALRLEPAMVLDARFNLGVVLGELGKLNEAVQAYTSALEQDPTHQGSLLNLAAIWYSEHSARRKLYQQQQQQPNGGSSTQQGGSDELLLTALELVDRVLAKSPASEDAKGLRDTLTAAMAVA